MCKSASVMRYLQPVTIITKSLLTDTVLRLYHYFETETLNVNEHHSVRSLGWGNLVGVFRAAKQVVPMRAARSITPHNSTLS